MNRREMLMYALSAVTLGVTGALAGCGTAGGGGQAAAPAASTEAPAAASAPVAVTTQPTPTTAATPQLPPTQAATFVQPTVLTSQNPTLTTAFASNKLGSKTVSTRTYNGVVGGPTVRARPGDRVSINLVNNLPANPDQDTQPSDPDLPFRLNSTNLHLHGMHVSPTTNNVFTEVAPGQSLQYDVDIPANHPSGTFFYHPEKLGAVAAQCFSGMGGAFIVEGGLDDVPEIKAAADFVFLINELNVNSSGEVPVVGKSRGFKKSRVKPRAGGDGTGPNGNGGPNNGGPYPRTQRILTVNGQLNPVLNLSPGQVVRLRIINATPRTFVPFEIPTQEMHLIAFDGVALPEMRTTRSVLLAPGNRADVLLKIASPGSYVIMKATYRAGNVSDPADFLANIEVANVQPVDMPLPSSLQIAAAPADIPASEVSATRTINMCVNAPSGAQTSPSFNINGARFDASVVNVKVGLGSVEEWTLVNQDLLSEGDHPFHLQTSRFQVIAVNGAALPQPEWRDTVNVPSKGNVTIRVRFDDFPGLSVFHCNHATHRELGMMQTVQVV